jgi:hypothetical protein
MLSEVDVQVDKDGKETEDWYSLWMNSLQEYNLKIFGVWL